jgi:HTH-type transcriptional regulator, sugar sensing transcriptional regulator
MYKQLEKMGLNLKEAAIYEALIKRGELTPSQIATESKLTREYVYAIAAELENKEIIEQVPNRKKVTYRAMPPEKIRDYLKTEKKVIEEKERAFEVLYPQLLNQYKLGSGQSGVTSFRGIDGIKHIYEGTFYQPKLKELFIFSSPKDEVLGPYLDGHIKKVTIKGLRTKVLSPKSRKLTNNLGGIKIDREIRYIDDDLFIFPTEIAVGNKFVVLSSYDKDKGSIVIENKDVIITFTNLFNYLWNVAKK